MSERPLTGFKIVAPSTVTVGEQFLLKIKALTEPYKAPVQCYRKYPRLASPFNLSPRGIHYLDNAAPRWEGVLEIEGPRGPSEIDCADLAGTFPGDDRAIGEIEGFSFDEEGVHFVRVTDPKTGITGESNAVCVSAERPTYRLYWGDPHSQTFFSDGLRCPEELYHFARHEGFLDIFALADHAEHITDQQWEYFVNVTNDWNRPGEYVTLVGLEWTNSGIGHRNLYYPGDWGPIVRSGEATAQDLEQLYEVAREHGGLLIPHHSANVTMGVKWDVGYEPEHERLVEIHSIWGNSERPAAQGNPRPIRTLGGEQEGQHVIDALARGYRFGFVGGGDIHDGRPGDELHNIQQRPESYGLLSPQGIMGVWARELTREAIWEALWERRCFATTNVRVPVRFEVSGDPPSSWRGVPPPPADNAVDAPSSFMGGPVRLSGPRFIRLWAASEVPIVRTEIVKNGEDHFIREGAARVHEWEFQDAASAASDYYYARITREDGEIAWSSPVWVNA